MTPDLHNRRGLTLMEILVVVAIIGAIMALGIGAVQVTFDLDLEKASRDLSSTMRYLYGESARTGEIYRVMIDLDEEYYRVESAPNTPETLAAIAREKRGQETPETEGATHQEEAREKTALAEEGRDAALPMEGFTPLDEAMAKPKKTRGVFFKDVFVAHGEEKQEEGEVAIYFFPNGSTEYAIINLSDEEESVFYSIEVNPLTGKTKIRSEYYENPY